LVGNFNDNFEVATVLKPKIINKKHEKSNKLGYKYKLTISKKTY